MSQCRSPSVVVANGIGLVNAWLYLSFRAIHQDTELSGFENLYPLSGRHLHHHFITAKERQGPWRVVKGING